MLNVTVFTGTRSEYGLLYWLLKDIQSDPELKLQLIVSAMHLSPEFGYTKEHIELDGFVIDETVEMLLSSSSKVGCAKSVGLGIIGYADSLQRLKPDIIIVLGDRFEALAIAQTAMFMDIPIAHLHGGEITEGAKDDAIRHAVTKLSNLHFTSTQAYQNRVIQLGEAPDSVFNVGALGLEHINRSELMTKSELEGSIHFKLTEKYFLVTYHSVTLIDEDPIKTVEGLLLALDHYKHYQLIITYPNADDGGREIILLLEQYAKENPKRVFLSKSLGFKRYLSAVKYATAVIGNSSSGIIEVPAFGVPTINIGSRQQGRLSANSVVHCATYSDAISMAINTVIQEDFLKRISPIVNPYGMGNSSEKILDVIKTTSLTCVKRFYDLKNVGSQTDA